MSEWFEEDKVYRFKTGYKDIFNETCGANKRIAQFIDENSFKVKIDPAKNVISIKREIDDCWYKAVDVMGECYKDSPLFSIAYMSEYYFFEEVQKDDSVSKFEIKADKEIKWKVVGITGCMFYIYAQTDTKEEAKKKALEYLEEYEEGPVMITQDAELVSVKLVKNVESKELGSTC